MENVNGKESKEMEWDTLQGHNRKQSTRSVCIEKLKEFAIIIRLVIGK